MSDRNPIDSAPAEAQAAPWTLFPFWRRTLFLIVLCLIATSNYVDRSILGILLEPIKREFHATDTQMGLLTGISFALFYATLGIPIARMADRGSRVWIITFALTVWSIMTVISGAAQSFWQLALARIGVGAGEAGALPPSHSLIADYFPPAQRARALAIFQLASTAGLVLANSGGGWLAQTHGWRVTLFAVGAPGLLLALLARFVLREPRRHRLNQGRATMVLEPLGRTFRVLFAKPAFRYVLASMVLYFFLAYGALIFTPTFIVRVNHKSLAEAGGMFGLISAGGAVVGSVLGGALADAAVKRDPKWLCRLCALGLVLAWPLYAFVFMTPDPTAMYTALFATIAIISGVVPSLYAALHMVVGTARRATAISVALLLINLVGIGAGPVITGVLSDYFKVEFGASEGLRWALVIVVAAFAPSALAILMAQNHLARDSES